MRFEVVKWAWDVSVDRSATKLVLVLMASHADAMECFSRTLPYVANKTGLNPKTVSKAVSDLIKLGFIIDTGKRFGGQGRSKIYQLVITKTHQDGECNSTNNGTINGADTSIKLSTGSTKNGTIQSTQKRYDSGGNQPKNGTIQSYQKRYDVFKDLIYIYKQPLLDITTAGLWITYLQNNYFDYFMTLNIEHVLDVQISFGDHQKQAWVVKNAIKKKWKHLHSDNSGKSKNGNQAISKIRQSAGLMTGIN